MRIRLLTAVLFTVLSVATASAQYYSGKKPLYIPKEEFHHLVITDVDVVIMQANIDHVGVKTQDKHLAELDVRFKSGTLYISPKKGSKPNERILVGVQVHELESLSLKGSASVRSLGVLNTALLRVNLLGEGQASLTTNGKVDVNSDSEYQVKRDNQSMVVYSASK
jgi:hypothetical protein